MEHARPKMTGLLLSKLSCQLKSGCAKPLCFGKNCKSLTAGSDTEILKHAVSLLVRSEDPHALLCSEPVYCEGHSHRVPYQTQMYLRNVCPVFLMQSLEWFCCAFPAVEEPVKVDHK
jgi:hypothetical protein